MRANLSCGLIFHPNTQKRKSNKSWFDNECRQKRKRQCALKDYTDYVNHNFVLLKYLTVFVYLNYCKCIYIVCFSVNLYLVFRE